jgi:ribonuclease Z
LGYVFREISFPSRKIVILGDTSDPSAIIPLCISPPPSLLVHEATDAYIPRTIQPHAKRTAQDILRKTLERGHSTPAMAGEFALKVGAKMLVLNHISGRCVISGIPQSFDTERSMFQVSADAAPVKDREYCA